MKYPKLWNGDSAVGEALVRALQRNGCKHLSAETSDGVRANTQGRFSEVKQGGEYRYYTYDIETGRSPVLRGSWDYRTPFRKISEHRSDDAARHWFVSTLTAGGRVFGLIQTGESRTWRALISAKRGVCSKNRRFIGTLENSSNIWPVHGAKVGGDAQFGVGHLPGEYANLNPNDRTVSWVEARYAQILPEFNVVSLWSLTNVQYPILGQFEHFTVHRAGPSTLYAFSIALDPYGEWLAPPLMMSQDNGVTWSAIAPNWPGFADSPVTPRVVFRCQVHSAPGEPGTLVAVIRNNTWMKVTDDASADDREGTGVWLITPSGVQKKVAHATLEGYLDTQIVPGYRNPLLAPGFPLRMSDSVWVLLRQLSRPIKAKIFKFSLTGELLSVFGETPFTSDRVGYPSVTHDGKVMCPMYFAGEEGVPAGVYLYVFEKDEPDAPDESGQWVRRAMIKRLDSYTPPSDQHLLPYCTQVVYANNAAGFPAPTYPAAPDIGAQP